LPLRKQLFQALEEKTFDLLIIGGGATGAGIAFDAAQRGYQVALIEADDYGSGASSCSTKLLHGGIRYLERALLHWDWNQLKFVRESLKEREILFKIAPHLTRAIPIMLPFYHMFDRYYYPLGFKIYEWIASGNTLPSTYQLSKEEALNAAPFLKQEGLRGAVVYHDGQFDDARFNLALIMTAIQEGVVALNYTKLTGFVKESEKVVGVKAVDCLTGKKKIIKASLTINATGSGADIIRLLDDPCLKPMLKPSVGSHLVFDQAVQMKETGILIPKTADGRVLFILPWKGKTLVGTTDRPVDSDVGNQPEEDIRFLLEHINGYICKPLIKKDISAVWSGIRPLCQKEQKSIPSSQISRDHCIEETPSGLLTIAGGKWTTYRWMAEDLLNRLVHEQKLPYKNPCRTSISPLIGAQWGYFPLAKELAERFLLDDAVVNHLIRSYGDQAEKVATLADQGLKRPLHPRYPFIEAEVIYALREEHAQKISDVILRRCGLGFLDQHAALECIPRIGELFAQERKWTNEEYLNQCAEAIDNLRTIC
jgi:glycerol-3-phosphate dehydrogenase